MRTLSRQQRRHAQRKAEAIGFNTAEEYLEWQALLRQEQLDNLETQRFARKNKRIALAAAASVGYVFMQNIIASANAKFENPIEKWYKEN